MKPWMDDFMVVTATTDRERSRACRHSWTDQAHYHWPTVIVENTPSYLGTVPAFARGVEQALRSTASVIACLHDDLRIDLDGWDSWVMGWFDSHPRCGLLGFGGGTGLGADAIYQSPYNPMQLARQDFVSNLEDAEAHGRRGTTPERVACLDGFSQIGRREFWEGWAQNAAKVGPPRPQGNLFAEMASWGVTHHFYDGMLGALAARLDWEVWFLPVRCRHFGGQTAVGDAGYAEWAKTQHPDGDQGFWQDAHRIGYDRFRDVLPLRVR